MVWCVCEREREREKERKRERMLLHLKSFKISNYSSILYVLHNSISVYGCICIVAQGCECCSVQ